MDKLTKDLQPRAQDASYTDARLWVIVFTRSRLRFLTRCRAACSSGLFHASMPRKSRKTYTRDDGCLMVEIRPNLYVEESMAERLGLLR